MKGAKRRYYPAGGDVKMTKAANYMKCEANSRCEAKDGVLRHVWGDLSITRADIEVLQCDRRIWVIWKAGYSTEARLNN